MKDLLVYIVCCSIAIAVTPIIAKISIKIGAVDKPNNRKVHEKIMPTLGGLSIFIAFVLGHVFFGYPHFQFKAIMAGSIIIIITGIIDDIYDLDPKLKLIAQMVAASIIIFSGGLYLRSINLPIIGLVELNYFGYFLTYLWIIGVTNAINLIDGLDGLASGVATITFMTMYILAIIEGDYFVMAYTLILAGASTGFLAYNFHPAKIFMGDTGAMFLGYIISVLALMGFKNATFISFVVPILILGVPVFDTAFAIIRRKLRGQSFAQADKEHIHHLLMTSNASQTKTVLIIYAISILFSAVAIIYTLVSPNLGFGILVVLFIIIQYIATKIGLLDRFFFPYSKITHTDENTISEDKILESTISEDKTPLDKDEN
ncbi:undecaprenyl/decaprenyl-phosphate alpha-N-acetylglucosaminyl 1-phosphate transferase [Alkalibaculum sp. M08DMB]|uniref:Undecaprenyl/decaprenyl-phosphate alpha-N-acetylglucosaminyl 1-phosphate transferase n=1 Tax=Alkalibaculum sporogenes TaxID=2655001 RepID=A0A6A7KDE5_9FIRM|nr:MraY family glycosyltransferase [Alkalibaculum sporogenes]MPW27187.1 undecaprenyl/decaprenyl-phosphate alpha-N-acetylglucosaminyl 1-phosphate transferase [Alkalibaculum sporogenes]